MSSISNDRLKNITQFTGIPTTKLQGLSKDTLEDAVTGFENAKHVLRLDADVQPKIATLSLNVTTFSSADLTASINGFADLAPAPVKVIGFGSVGSRPNIQGTLSFKPGVSTSDFLANANTAYVTCDTNGVTTVQFYDNSNGAGLTGDNYKGAFYGSGSGTGDFTGTATGVNWSNQPPTPIAPKQGTVTITITTQSAATIALDVAKFAKTSKDAAVTGSGSNGKRSGDGSLVVNGISDDTFIANTTTANVSLDVSGNLLVTFYDAKSVVTGTFTQTALKGTGNFTGWATSLTWTRQY